MQETPKSSAIVPAIHEVGGFFCAAGWQFVPGQAHNEVWKTTHHDRLWASCCVLQTTAEFNLGSTAALSLCDALSKTIFLKKG